MCIQSSIIKWSVFIYSKKYTVPVCVTLKRIFDNNNNIEGISMYIIIIMWERCRKHVSGICGKYSCKLVKYSFAGSMCPAYVGNIPTH